MMPLSDFDTFAEQPEIVRLLPDVLPNFSDHLEALGGTYHFYPIRSARDMLMDHSGLVLQRFKYRQKTLELLCQWADFSVPLMLNNTLKTDTQRTKSNLRRHTSVIDSFNQFVLACEKKLFKFHAVNLRLQIVERMTKTSARRATVHTIQEKVQLRLKQFENDFYCKEVLVSPLKVEFRLLHKLFGVSYMNPLSGLCEKIKPALNISISRIHDGNTNVRAGFYFSGAGIYSIKYLPVKNVKEQDLGQYTFDMLKRFSRIWDNSVASATDRSISTKFVRVRSHSEFVKHQECADWALASALAQDKKHVSLFDLCFAFAFVASTKKHNTRNLIESMSWRLAERMSRDDQD